MREEDMAAGTSSIGFALTLKLEGDHESIVMRPREIDSQHAEFELDDLSFVLFTHRCSTIHGCARDLGGWLADALGSKLFGRDTADLLLVHPSSDPGRVWLCAIRLSGVSWRGDAIDVQRQRNIDTDFAILNTGDQEQNIQVTYSSFRAFFPEWTQHAQSRANPGLLRVKVDPGELWFLKFPLGFFAQMQLGGFQHYSGCQWIVTDRTISATAAAQLAAERGLADTRTFFESTWIIINTYLAHQRSRVADTLVASFTLIEEVLRQFTDISFGQDTVTLQWTFNPPPDLLAEILTSHATRFVFADFEAKGNVWRLGDGPHKCYQACGHTSQAATDFTFDLSPFQDKLAHISLMRTYHCNSVYDPFRSRLSPAGSDTLAGKLLAAGITFVEGSLTEEPTLDYICELLNLLLGRSDLKSILWGRSLAGLCDLDGLLTRANALLAMRDRPKLSAI
jgi:hypothetical protein